MTSDEVPPEFLVVVRSDGTILVNSEDVRSGGFTPGTPLRLQARLDDRDFKALLEAEIASGEDVDEDAIMDAAVEAVRKVRRDRAERGESGSGAS